MDKIYEQLNSAWKITSGIMFGRELGELNEFRDYFMEYRFKGTVGSSTISGQEVFTASEHYPKTSEFISFSELEQYGNKKFEPLNINEVKDIDSIIEALKERFVYVGNVVKGKSSNVEKSTAITDSHYVLECIDVSSSKFTAYTSRARYANYFFGVDWGGEGNFVVRCLDFHKNKKAFEAHACYGTSEVYFSFGVRESTEIMFSFGGSGRRYLIGNLQLPKDKYKALKDKLISEMADELEKNKRLPSLFELATTEKPEIDEKLIEELRNIKPEDRGNKKELVEESFRKTVKVVLNTELNDTIDNYSEWLLRNVNMYKTGKSAATGRDILVGSSTPYWKAPFTRVVSLEEFEYLSNKMTMDSADNLSFENIGDKLKPFFLFTTDMVIGTIYNVIDSVVLSGNTLNCYRICGSSESKDSGFSFWPRNSSYIFGSNTVFHSSFVLKGYFSTRINRGFEVDVSNNCNDIYYSHNCESCSDVMFCFNKIGGRYAIGNVELGKEEYKKIKEMVLEQLSTELKEKKSIKWSVFDLGKKDEKI